MEDFDFREIKEALKLPSEFEVPGDRWHRIESFYGKVPKYFLERRKLIEILDWFDIETDLVEAIFEKLEVVKSNHYWNILAYHLYDILFLDTGDDAGVVDARSRSSISRLENVVRKWPRLTGLLGDNSNLFYAFPYLYRIPEVLKMYRERGLSREIALATLRDLFLWMYEYKRQYGEWGLMELGWFMLHFNLRLFQLGRLQFEISRFGYDFHVLRNKQRGDILMLAGEGMRFRGDGQFFDADRVTASDYWEAHYESGESEYVGYIIDGRGFATRELVHLSKGSWNEVLKRKDYALGVHIPAGGKPPGHGPMSEERCEESFSMAREFFSRHFPEKHFGFFTCTSWMLDPQLKLYLKGNSNIVAFQRRFYLHPVPGADDRQIYERVFSYDKSKWASAPAVTSLQRVIRQHEAHGGKWRITGGVFPL